MKIARILWNVMAVIGIVVTIVTIGDQLVDAANFIVTTFQQVKQ